MNRNYIFFFLIAVALANIVVNLLNDWLPISFPVLLLSLTTIIVSLLILATRSSPASSKIDATTLLICMCPLIFGNLIFSSRNASKLVQIALLASIAIIGLGAALIMSIKKRRTHPR